MCPHCRAFITTTDRVCPYCDAQVGQRAIDVRHPSDILGGFIPHARFTTSIILLLNCGLFAVTLALSMGAVSMNALTGIEGDLHDLPVMAILTKNEFMTGRQRWRRFRSR